jgi:5-methylcytosine-specific restriction enzyme B
MIKSLQITKNLILQGPPGTGKTWLAKRLAYALVGNKDANKVRSFQFHPNLSYEDFIRGWRPSGDGKLTLVDGPFLEMVNEALKQQNSMFVIVIEEINRGNPAQIFGEMLTLMEADRRNSDCSLELCNKKTPNERIYIPENLYVIGTMNIADRSLALVDFALRRRFAFVDLEPKIGKTWRDWVISQFGMESEIVSEIEKRILNLNDEIRTDSSLGRQFCIGHSFITPPKGTTIISTREWFIDIVNTKIGTLLEEYWFDDREKAQKAKQKLIVNF